MLVERHGQPGWVAALTPLSVDGISVAASTRAKCYRKAALCYIEKGEYSKATTVTRRCSTNEAATHYLLLLAAVKQGRCRSYGILFC